MGLLKNQDIYIKTIMSFTNPKIDTTPIYKKNPLKVKKSKITYNTYRRKEDRNEFDYYRDKVKILTNEVCHLVEGIEHRSFKGPHIDHKISIRYGYDNNIPAENIAHISNLRMLSAKDNLAKRTNNFVDEKNKWILNKSN
jgi:hypothetical protein